MDQRAIRRTFLSSLWFGVRMVWPILSGLLAAMVLLGVVAGLLERWPLVDSLYFAFVTGLTIGYGDLVPTTLLARALAVVIGLIGILLTGLVVAVGVQALLATARASRER